MILCKCCGKEARWCNEGVNKCGDTGCSNIHCDHCGMHYSLENDDVFRSETSEQCRILMVKAYGLLDNLELV
jgi:hypothetical protein